MINHASRAFAFGALPALVVSLMLGAAAPAAASEGAQTPLPTLARAPAVAASAVAAIAPAPAAAPSNDPDAAGHPALLAVAHNAAQARLAAAHLTTAPRTASVPPPKPIAAGPVWTDASGTWRQVGVASWYGGKRWQGKKTASGVRYDERLLTAAHASLPIGSRVRVTVAGTDRTVVVTINDRPGTRKRIIDLSRAAAAELGIIGRGVADVHITPG